MNDDVKNKDTKGEIDPMNVDKKGVDLEEQAAEGGFFPTTADASRANKLDSVSYEDIQQIFGKDVSAEDGVSVEGDTPGAADNVTSDLQNEEDVEE